jgi:hypothetical protein
MAKVVYDPKAAQFATRGKRIGGVKQSFGPWTSAQAYAYKQQPMMQCNIANGFENVSCALSRG